MALNYSFIYVGERYHNSANIPANHEQPWYTHDVSISYEMPVGGKMKDENRKTGCMPRLYFALEINNMLNQQYDVIQNYPMPGINGKGIVRVML